MRFLSLFSDLPTLLLTFGYAGLFIIIFAESGLLIGFFFPGDSLLFTAGFLASQRLLHIWVIVVGSIIAAILGDSVGYAFGRRVGPALFRRNSSLLFNPKNLERARRFYETHGGKALIFARFMPVVRTFVPILAGVGDMRYRKFLTFNAVGGTIWGGGMPLLGYFLGSIIPGIDTYLLPVVLAIIIISMLPSVIHVLRDPDGREAIRGLFKKRYTGGDGR